MHWFYCVFAHSLWQTNGFSVFSLRGFEGVFSTMTVCFRWHTVQNHLLYCVLYVNENKQAENERTKCFSREQLSLMIKHDMQIDFGENPRCILKLRLSPLRQAE